MKNILVIGSTGQIGSELTMELRQRYGGSHVVAGYIHGAEPHGALAESGPMALADVTDGDAIAAVVKEHHIDTIYNLAALLGWPGRLALTACGIFWKWRGRSIALCLHPALLAPSGWKHRTI